MAVKTVHILDYGGGNIQSLLNAVRYLGWNPVLINDTSDLDRAERVIFPGVGGFEGAVGPLRERGLLDQLKRYVLSDRKLFGICIGLQVLGLSSAENPETEGLGIIPQKVTRLSSNDKAVPHIGWNKMTLADGRVMGPYYFVHSYAFPWNPETTKEWAYGLTRYGGEVFVSSVRKGNIFATQFHPERSGTAGLELIRKFLEDELFSEGSEPMVPWQTPNIAELVKDELTKRIVTCLDVRTDDMGELVVTKGDQYDVRDKSDAKVRNLGNPVSMAREYYEAGADEIVFLSIVSFRNCPLLDLPMLSVLRETAKQCFVPLTIGGGISGDKAYDIATEYFRSGADKVSIGSDAVRAAELYFRRGGKALGDSCIEKISQKYGRQAVVISLDPVTRWVNTPLECTKHVVKSKEKGPLGQEYCWWQCTTKGGRELSDLSVIEVAQACTDLGAGEVLVNCIDRDGTNRGFDTLLMDTIAAAVDVPIIASSGAGTPEHFRQVFDRPRCEAALAAGQFHRGSLTVGQVKSYLKAQGIAVRDNWSS